ncbi:hypothetical protein BR93DRAFT_931843 [Coniochaeta sp. PMI_546]|nr:hypothetical protein BR93DRAFT_931843 [Coniochaeta sp. PMI_546]
MTRLGFCGRSIHQRRKERSVHLAPAAFLSASVSASRTLVAVVFSPDGKTLASASSGTTSKW